jgi:hypothetical protein
MDVQEVCRRQGSIAYINGGIYLARVGGKNF